MKLSQNTIADPLPTVHEQAGGTRAGKGKWAQAVGWLISICCLGVIARNVRFDEVMLALENFHWPYVALGLTSLAFGFAMRIVRWRVMLVAAGARVTLPNCASAFLGSIALNNILPLRLGDVVRALVFPAALGVPRVTASGSLIMERLLDLVTLLACLASGMLLTRGIELPEWVKGGAVVLAAVSAVSLAAIFLASGWLARVTESFLSNARAIFKQPLTIGAQMLHGFEAMSRPSVIGMLFLLSFLAWCGETGLYWSLLRGFDLVATPGTALIVMGMVTLSTLAPSSPGYVGPFHLAAFTAISMLHGNSGQATSFAVLSHLTLWASTTAAGGLAMLTHPQLFRGLSWRRS